MLVSLQLLLLLLPLLVQLVPLMPPPKSSYVNCYFQSNHLNLTRSVNLTFETFISPNVMKYFVFQTIFDFLSDFIGLILISNEILSYAHQSCLSSDLLFGHIFLKL